MNDRRERREAYEQLMMEHFEETLSDGASYYGKEVMQEEVARELPPDDPSFLTPAGVVRASREATLRLADKGISVTSPTPANGYLRTAMASDDVIEDSRKIGDKQIRTRIKNQKRVYGSDSLRPNASEYTKEQARIYDAFATLYDAVAERKRV